MRLRNYQDIIFRFINMKAKLIGLLTSSYNIFSKVLTKKSPFKSIIAKFYTVCSHLWQNCLALQYIVFLFFIKSWYIGRQSFIGWFSFESFSETNKVKKNPRLSALKLFNWNYWSFKTTMQRSKRYNQRIYQKTEN